MNFDQFFYLLLFLCLIFSILVSFLDENELRYQSSLAVCSLEGKDVMHKSSVIGLLVNNCVSIWHIKLVTFFFFISHLSVTLMCTLSARVCLFVCESPIILNWLICIMVLSIDDINTFDNVFMEWFQQTVCDPGDEVVLCILDKAVCNRFCTWNNCSRNDCWRWKPLSLTIDVCDVTGVDNFNSLNSLIFHHQFVTFCVPIDCIGFLGGFKVTAAVCLRLWFETQRHVQSESWDLKCFCLFVFVFFNTYLLSFCDYNWKHVYSQALGK